MQLRELVPLGRRGTMLVRHLATEPPLATLRSVAWYALYKHLRWATRLLAPRFGVQLGGTSERRGPLDVHSMRAEYERYISEDATIFGHSGLLVGPDGKVLNEPNQVDQYYQIVRLAHQLTHAPATMLRGRASVHLPAGRHLNAIPVFPRNYFHWIAEVLPIVVILETASPQFGYILHPDAPAFQHEWLQLVGVEDTRIRTATRHRPLAGTVMAKPSVSVEDHSTYEPLRELITERLPTASPRAARLFIDRTRVRNRRITNKAEVVRFLQMQDFTIIDPAGLTVEETVQHIRTADIIVSVYGANMADVIFADDAHIIELTPSWRSGSAYEILGTCGHNTYSRIPCAQRGGDITVDLDALTGELRSTEDPGES